MSRIPLALQVALLAYLPGLAPMPRRPEEEQPLSLGVTPQTAQPWLAPPPPPLDVDSPKRERAGDVEQEAESSFRARYGKPPHVAYVAPAAGPDLSPAPGWKGAGKGTRRERKAGRK